MGNSSADDVLIRAKHLILMSCLRMSPDIPSAQYIYSTTKLMIETIIIPVNDKIG